MYGYYYLVLQPEGGSFFFVNSDIHIDDNEQWHYITATFDGYSSKIYVDGILEGENNTLGNTPIILNDTEVPVNFGRTRPLQGNGEGSNYTYAYYDDISIWNRYEIGNGILDTSFCIASTGVPAAILPKTGISSSLSLVFS